MRGYVPAPGTFIRVHIRPGKPSLTASGQSPSAQVQIPDIRNWQTVVKGAPFTCEVDIGGIRVEIKIRALTI